MQEENKAEHVYCRGCEGQGFDGDKMLLQLQRGVCLVIISSREVSQTWDCARYWRRALWNEHGLL